MRRAPARPRGRGSCGQSWLPGPVDQLLGCGGFVACFPLHLADLSGAEALHVSPGLKNGCPETRRA
ncbi:hypothetical protein NDU88_004011, partial [Pleurodeles waltl]